MSTYIYGNGKQGSTPTERTSSKKKTSTDFNTKYASNIAGVADANGVDLGVAAAMLGSNVTGASNYNGAGAIDYGTAKSDLMASNTAAQRAKLYNGTSNSAADYYSQYLDDQQAALRQAQEAATAAAQARTNAAVDANNAYIPQVNQQTDKQLQQAYITSQQAKSNAPQSLAALGYTGGATESSLLGIDANYGNQRNDLETSRNTSLDQIRNNAQQIQASGNADLSDLAANYYNQMATAQQNAASAAQTQSNWQQQFDATQAATAKSDYANTASAYYNDYQAQINKLKALGYTDDDYEVKVVKAQQQQKILDQQELARTQAQQALENQQNQQQLDYQTGKPYYNPKTTTRKATSSAKKYTPSQVKAMYDADWIDEATAKSMLGL